MVYIGPFDLEKKAGIVGVILENPLQASKKAAGIGAYILEIRLDLLGIKSQEIARSLIQQIKSETGLPVIITNRSSLEGGKWEGREAERLELLRSLLFLKDGPDAVDIELSAAKEERDKLIKEAKTHGKTVIVSFHDFLNTPPFQEMKATLEEAFRAGGDIAKLAVMPHSMRNVLDLLELTLEFREAGKPICTISMGKLGKHTRVIAPFYGSVLTYASIENTIPAAAGQISIAEVKRIMEALE
ncbi:MAG: type I 3-dehydroquinate dehydratase [Methanosarcina sp.]